MSHLDPSFNAKLQVSHGSLESKTLLRLTTAQLGIWFAQQADPSSPAYNIGEYLEINGYLDPFVFEQALRQVVHESDALRVQIVERADGPYQVIGAAAEWSLPVIDVSVETDARAAAESWMKHDLARPIWPTHGPLFAFALFKASPNRFFWYARYHHIVMDGFGMCLVARRLADVYTQLYSGRAAPDRSFGSLAVLLEEDAAYRASEHFARDREYWFDCLADGLELLDLGSRPSVKPHGFLRNSGYLARSSMDHLCSIAQRMGTAYRRLLRRPRQSSYIA